MKGRFSILDTFSLVKSNKERQACVRDLESDEQSHSTRTSVFRLSKSSYTKSLRTSIEGTLKDKIDMILDPRIILNTNSRKITDVYQLLFEENEIVECARL